MNVNGRHFRTIWIKEGSPEAVEIIDQRQLPHFFVIEELTELGHFVRAIRDMHVRGAGLIGAAAGYGMYCACVRSRQDGPGLDSELAEAASRLKAARPTAVNLAWAVERQLQSISRGKTAAEKRAIAFGTAGEIANGDAEACRMIGQHGLQIIEKLSARKGNAPVNILTHCNAGWLAFVDYGSATAPIYAAHDKGIPVHVWVDETRPWNQGARLTAWELGQHGVPHTIIADNAGGHLMQHGQVDMVIVGSDRTTRAGDVANKIGTYLKAVAARDNDIPFYVALPSSTFDWNMADGLREIPIEERSGDELHYLSGLSDGKLREVRLTPAGSAALNYSFDVTPARLVTGLITERGVCPASEPGISGLFPEKV
jgi:methylthioribose-1-phosphate isomerase